MLAQRTSYQLIVRQLVFIIAILLEYYYLLKCKEYLSYIQVGRARNSSKQINTNILYTYISYLIIIKTLYYIKISSFRPIIIGKSRITKSSIN